MANSSTYLPIRVAASVTLFNSLPSCLDAISTYRDQVERIYVIDNSEHPDNKLLEELAKWNNVRYISNGGNQGVAAALNSAAEQASADGFDFLLTMDDDTALSPGYVSTILSFICSSEKYMAKAGIVSGVHSPSIHKVASRSVLYTMTSGNLLNLRIYKEVGPFRHDFFIDHIDHEYGMRLNKAGFKVIELPALQLQHQLGERKQSGFGTYQFVSHSPIRGYYMVRNGWLLTLAYPSFKRQAFKLISKEWLKAILFEDQKAYRIRLLALGLRDAWRRRLGKFSV